VEEPVVGWIILLGIATLLCVVAVFFDRRRRRRVPASADQWNLEEQAARDANRRNDRPDAGGFQQGPSPF
jgi:hypothetical protein